MDRHSPKKRPDSGPVQRRRAAGPQTPVGSGTAGMQRKIAEGAMPRRLKQNLMLWLCGLAGTGALILVLGLVDYVEGRL